ncbi:MAG: hypothetical protein ACYCPR_05485 [Thermoplasmataceae archaeon]
MNVRHELKMVVVTDNTALERGIEKGEKAYVDDLKGIGIQRSYSWKNRLLSLRIKKLTTAFNFVCSKLGYDNIRSKLWIC